MARMHSGEDGAPPVQTISFDNPLLLGGATGHMRTRSVRYGEQLKGHVSDRVKTQYRETL